MAASGTILRLMTNGLRGSVRQLLDLPVVNILAAGEAGALIRVVGDHFTLSGLELGQAFQESFERATAAIALGVAPPGILSSLKQRAAANLTREFSSKIEAQYLTPFAERSGWEATQVDRFRSATATTCRQLSREAARIVPTDQVGQPELSELLQDTGREAIGTLLVDLIDATGIVSLEDACRGFLTGDDLLGNGVVFFFRERLRQDGRVKATLDALRQEGLWTDVRALGTAQGELRQVLEVRSQAIGGAIDRAAQAMKDLLDRKDFQGLGPMQAQLTELSGQQSAVAAQLEDLPTRLAALRDLSDHGFLRLEGAFRALNEGLGGRFDEVLDGLDGIGDRIEGRIDRLESALLQRLDEMMQVQNLGARIKASDVFTQHNPASLKLIEAAAQEIDRARPTQAGYVLAATRVGSAMMSTGNAAAAEMLLEKALTAAGTAAERGLAHYNLFQAKILQEQFAPALTSLSAAIAEAPESYDPHWVERYPIEKILGAGGMGCAFLCREPVRGGRPVVVKTFWEAEPGSLEEVFAEVQAMDEAAGAYVPKVYDYNFARGLKTPYIAMQYLDGYEDGAAFIGRHGPLSVEEGLSVALDLARALEIAHDKGVLHLDLKPGNLLLRRGDDGALSVKVIDFGLARVVRSLRRSAALTRTSRATTMLAQTVLGTMDYAPPEQQGETAFGPPGEKSDLFSFGATLYHLLSGRNPRRLRADRLPDNAVLQSLVFDCVEEDPSDRPASASALVARLEVCAKWTDPVTGMEFLWVPGGSFDMGCVSGDSDCSDDEKPVHRVTLDGFWLGKYPVTQGEWQKVMGSNPSHFKKGDRHPVESVSWDDVQVFIEKLSGMGSAQFSLPSEAQWEYACRSGGKAEKYSGGSDIGAVAWHGENWNRGHHPVGGRRANGLGLHDMSGNVWEWVQDKYGGYSNSTLTNPIYEASGSSRVGRGGGWSYGARSVRCADRVAFGPGFRFGDLGFRLLRKN